jgi:hypothetical protein
MTKRLLLGTILFTLLAGCADAHAQQRMSRDERQRMREDMNTTRRDVYKDQRQGQRKDALPPAGGRMPDAERDKLRRDMMDANRGMPRR